MAYKSKKSKDADNELWRDYQQELKDFQEADLDQREQARECDRFLLEKDGQWEEHVARTLDSQKRPRYTFDKVTPVIESMMAEIEDMDFGCNVKPGDGAADKDIALTYEGMIRSIQNESSAEDLFRNAARRIIRRGFDAWMVRAKYVDEWSFEQDLRIVPIVNAINRVWAKPDCQSPDSSDSDVMYVLTSLSVDAYETKYPDGSKISVDDSDVGDYYDHYKPDVITIAERWYQKDEEVEVALLSNGEVVQLDDKWDKVKDEYAANGITIKKTKKAKNYKWYYCVFDGGCILEEERETVFKTNPIVTVYGNYEHLGQSSKITYSGITLKEMDAQRVHNYAKSREIEEGALSPRPKYLMTKKMAKGHEPQIARMNASTDPVQFFNPDPELPGYVPAQSGGAQINPHLATLGAQMGADIKEQAGVFDAMQGKFAGRQSEDSIRMQIDRGTAATRKWINPLIIGIRRTCQILVDTIPATYDTQRAFAILGEDGAEDMIQLNQEVYDQQTQTMVKINDLNRGKYRVYCDAGPAFSNKLEAGMAALMEYAAIDPSVVQMAGDVMLKSIDAPLVDKIAERKRAQMLQAGMIPVDQMTDEEKQQMMQQMQQPRQPDPMAIAAMAEADKARAANTEAETKRIKVLADAQNEQQKRQVDVFKAQTDRMGTQIDAQEAGATINNKNIDAFGKQLDNAAKAQQLQVQKFQQMSNEELLRIAASGQ